MSGSRTPDLANHSPADQDLYRRRVKEFLITHPYCQVWLTEHGIAEVEAWQHKGKIPLGDGRIVSAPASTRVVHKVRRNSDLLDEFYWLAVSDFYQQQIVEQQAWARSRGYLVDA